MAGREGGGLSPTFRFQRKLISLADFGWWMGVLRRVPFAHPPPSVIYPPQVPGYPFHLGR
jgi:hypothetical protein